MKNMLKHLIILVLCTTICSISHALSTEKLAALSNEYISFLISIGKLDPNNNGFPSKVEEKMQKIFAPDCQKIVNAQLIFNSFDVHIDQLRNALKEIGPWTIKKLDTWVASNQNTCIIKFKCSSKTIEPHTIMIVLTFNDEMLITEINEVYSKCTTSEID